MPYLTAASFFERSGAHHLVLAFDNLWSKDSVLVASLMGCHQLSQLEVSPYQKGLLVRGVHHQHQGQIPNGRIEQTMGYTGAVETMLMDEIARVCEQAEGRFTGIQTDIGKVETVGCQSAFLWPFSNFYSSATSHLFHSFFSPL